MRMMRSRLGDVGIKRAPADVHDAHKPRGYERQQLMRMGCG